MERKGDLLFDPAKVAQYNLETFLRIVKGLPAEEVERYITDAQIAQATKAAWREKIDPSQLTQKQLDEFDKRGGTDHSDPWFT